VVVSCRSAARATLGLVLIVSLGACGKIRYTRDQVRDRWVNTYLEQLDLTPTEAACIVDRFFGELSDAALKPLTKGSDLSDAQVRRIGELAIDCGVGQGSPATATSST
jgi:hypothetical protein